MKEPCHETLDSVAQAPPDVLDPAPSYDGADPTFPD